MKWFFSFVAGLVAGYLICRLIERIGHGDATKTADGKFQIGHWEVKKVAAYWAVYWSLPFLNGRYFFLTYFPAGHHIDARTAAKACADEMNARGTAAQDLLSFQNWLKQGLYNNAP